jgi:hypothetical protein
MGKEKMKRISKWGGWFLLLFAALWLSSCSVLQDLRGSSEDEGSQETASQERATMVAELDQGEQPLLVYQRSGEEEGQVFEWRVYADGRAASITPAGAGASQVTEVQVDEETVDQLFADLENAGFFEVADAQEGECCTQNNYAITVWQDGEAQSVTVDQITPQMSVQRLSSINYVERFVYQEITTNGEQ